MRFFRRDYFTSSCMVKIVFTRGEHVFYTYITRSCTEDVRAMVVRW